jgi:hypothetical protein
MCKTSYRRWITLWSLWTSRLPKSGHHLNKKFLAINLNHGVSLIPCVDKKKDVRIVSCSKEEKQSNVFLGVVNELFEFLKGKVFVIFHLIGVRVDLHVCRMP